VVVEPHRLLVLVTVQRADLAAVAAATAELVAREQVGKVITAEIQQVELLPVLAAAALGPLEEQALQMADLVALGLSHLFLEPPPIMLVAVAVEHTPERKAQAVQAAAAQVRLTKQ
jgi:hypothetical protein